MRYITTTKNLFNQIGAALVMNNTSASAAPVNWYSWKGSKIYINRGSIDYGMTFPPITLSAGTYTISAMASMNDINGSGRVVSIGYMDISNNWHNQYVTISSDNQKISYTFTLTEEAVIRINLQGRGTASNYNNLDTSFWGIQLELGDTATPYIPYGYLPMYKGRYKVSDVCQLMVYPYFETTLTRNGITFTDNGDGTITANGTSDGFATFVFSKNFNFIAGNKYYVSTPYSIIAYKDNGTMKYAQGNILFTWKSNWEIVQVYMQINKGITVSNLVFKPQLFDLTEMYGAGNEPTTVEEFREKFPNDLYPYQPYCWAKLKSLIYKDDINYLKMK